MNTNGNKNTLKANKILIPIILLIGLIPIIVHSFVYDTNLAQFDWYPESAAKQTDFFFCMEDDCDHPCGSCNARNFTDPIFE